MAVARLPPIKEGGHSINPFSLMKRLFLQPMLYVFPFLFRPVQTSLTLTQLDLGLLVSRLRYP